MLILAWRSDLPWSAAAAGAAVALDHVHAVVLALDLDELCSFSMSRTSCPTDLPSTGGGEGGGAAPVAAPPLSVRVAYGAASTPAPPNSIQLRLKKLLPGPPPTGLNTR